MEYRRLGRAGLKVSVLSLGSWITFGGQVDLGLARDVLVQARDAGVNFFDNAEAYAGGESESIMGRAIEELGWDRSQFVLSTKLYWGLGGGVNLENTLNRKYLLQAIDGSLERLRTGFVDLLFCHRPDPDTPIEETVWAMSDLVASGKALYWGTSEWGAEEIRAAWEIAERYHLRKPVMEQPQYNLFTRDRVEREYRDLCRELGLGLTTWSPLASGLLSGKYLDGVPQNSRASLAGFEEIRDSLIDRDRNDRVRQLVPIAEELGCTLAQLGIAWCAANPDVSSVILGATSAAQLQENLGALAVLPRLDRDVLARIDVVMAG
jgi:voltage-dependent potassium channel beta subunit